MESPLFKIPLELRQEIYNYVFEVSDGLIEPLAKVDYYAYSQDLSVKLEPREFPIHGVVSLLRVCHQVLDEATKILYGDYTFYFDDTALDYCRGKLDDPCLELDIQQYCEHCKEFEDHKNFENVLEDEIWKGWANWVMRDGRHILHIEHCGITDLVDWLERIGPQNSSFIRTLRLEVRSDKYTQFVPRWFPLEAEAWQQHLELVGGELFEQSLHGIGERLRLTRPDCSFRIFHSSASLSKRTLLPRGPRGHRERMNTMRDIIHASADLFLSGSWLRNVFGTLLSNGRVETLMIENFPSEWEDEILDADELGTIKLMKTVQKEITENSGLTMVETGFFVH